MEVIFPRSVHGFTIIEFVLIMLVIGVLSITAAIEWPALMISIGAQAEQIAADIRYTQTLAMTNDQRYCFKISENTYQIIASESGTPVTLGSGNTSVTLAKGLSFGTITPANLFVFDGQGTPYAINNDNCTTATAGHATVLTTAAHIPIASDTQTLTISITPETGRVSTQ